ncbi:MAG: hypothetical protein P8X57_06180 [Cyclobacteriaceae bacterium]
MKYLLFLSILMISFSVSAQVRHNFDMAPENTDCHLIKVEDKTATQLLQEIRQRSFRFSQKIRISRYRVPHQLEYFSCDGEKGFILAMMKDGQYDVYAQVPKSEWEALIDAKDILEYYHNQFTLHFTPVLTN